MTEQETSTGRQPLLSEAAAPSAPSQEAGARASEVGEALPEDAMIILPLRHVVLFPGVVMPLALQNPIAVAAAQAAAQQQRSFGAVLQLDPELEKPTAEQLHRIGTVAGVLRYVTAPDGTHQVVCQGEERFRIIEYLEGYPFLAARIERLPDQGGEGPEAEARLYHLKERSLEVLALLPQAPPELGNAIQGLSSPSQGADLVASFMDLKPEERQEILELTDVEARLDKVLAALGQRLEVLRLSRDIGEQTKETMADQQREYFLRQQLKTIQKELGEDEDGKA
ncbi:MAG: LON peptidase substrate-binding domain-containing protein [Geminicoccaceae bacterium]